MKIDTINCRVRRTRVSLAALAAILLGVFASVSPARADDNRFVPAGSVLRLRVEAVTEPGHGQHVHVDQPFRATVVSSPEIMGRAAVPAGSLVTGRVTDVRGDGAGAEVRILLDRVTSPSGASVPIAGDLAGHHGTVLTAHDLTAGGELRLTLARGLALREDFFAGTGGATTPPAATVMTPQEAAALDTEVSRILSGYARTLGIRYVPVTGQIIATRANYRENEIELLFALNALATSTRLYTQLVRSTNDPSVIAGASDVIVTQAGVVDRVAGRTRSPRAAATITAWGQLRDDFERLDDGGDRDVRGYRPNRP